MNRKIAATKIFSKSVERLIKNNQLTKRDFDDFKNTLSENPEMGDIVVGTGGVRKVRLKSASRGKSGGFRVCYYDVTQDNVVILLLIYAKNVEEDVSAQDKKYFKETVKDIKGK
jgi:mRNA-degrading endonuclease RelE of RelBE toxin-antitoxin system